MDDDTSKTFLGVGWGFPVALAAQGEVDLAAYEEDVRQAIRIILSTNHGERVMRPDFGGNLNALLFEPMNTTTFSLAQHYVEQALVEWEPRIDVLGVTVSSSNEDQVRGMLRIEIAYRIRATNTFYNLVYPFYLLEGASS
jgi:phage baseplate assembly protein W